MKAKIREPKSFRKKGYTYTYDDCYWKYKTYMGLSYPIEFYELMQRDIEVTIVESLTPKHGEYKFINPRDGKVYWVPVDWLKPILTVDI